MINFDYRVIKDIKNQEEEYQVVIDSTTQLEGVRSYPERDILIPTSYTYVNHITMGYFYVETKEGGYIYRKNERIGNFAYLEACKIQDCMNSDEAFMCFRESDDYYVVDIYTTEGVIARSISIESVPCINFNLLDRFIKTHRGYIADEVGEFTLYDTNFSKIIAENIICVEDNYYLTYAFKNENVENSPIRLKAYCHAEQEPVMEQQVTNQDFETVYCGLSGYYYYQSAVGETCKIYTKNLKSGVESILSCDFFEAMDNGFAFIKKESSDRDYLIHLSNPHTALVEGECIARITTEQDIFLVEEDRFMFFISLKNISVSPNGIVKDVKRSARFDDFINTHPSDILLFEDDKRFGAFDRNFNEVLKPVADAVFEIIGLDKNFIAYAKDNYFILWSLRDKKEVLKIRGAAPIENTTVTDGNVIAYLKRGNVIGIADYNGRILYEGVGRDLLRIGKTVYQKNLYPEDSYSLLNNISEVFDNIYVHNDFIIGLKGEKETLFDLNGERIM